MFNFLTKLKPFKSPTLQRLVTVDFSSIICEKSISTGNLLISNNIRIDGRHVGKIVKDANCTDIVTVIIAKSGVVEGSINVDNVIIEGSMKGITKANISLFVLGSIEGTAFYGNNLEISGSSSAQIVKLSERQMQIQPDNHAIIPAPEKIESIIEVIINEEILENKYQVPDFNENLDDANSGELSCSLENTVEQAHKIESVALSQTVLFEVEDSTTLASNVSNDVIDCMDEELPIIESVSLRDRNELDVDEVIAVEAVAAFDLKEYELEEMASVAGAALNESIAVDVEGMEALSVALNDSYTENFDNIIEMESTQMRQTIPVLTEKLYLVKSPHFGNIENHNETTTSQVAPVEIIQNYNYSPRMAFN